MINVGLIDSKNGNKAKINDLGEVIVAPIEFSKFYLGTMATNNVPVNVIKPKIHHIFVITDIILSANKDVGVNGSITTLYGSSDGPATATQTNIIIQDEIAKQTRTVLSGLNIKVDEGSWVNAVCDDNTVRANVAGYYLSS